LANRGQPAARTVALGAQVWQQASMDALPSTDGATAGAHRSSKGGEFKAAGSA